MNDKPKRRGFDLAGILFFALAGSLLLNMASPSAANASPLFQFALPQ